MKKNIFSNKILIFIILIVACMSFKAFKENSKEAEIEDSFSEKDVNQPTELSNKEESSVTKFNLIDEGKSCYTIVYPNNASTSNKSAAVMIDNHIKNNGVESYISNTADVTGEKCEILVGYTNQFPQEALDDVDMSQLGSEGLWKYLGRQYSY